MSDQFGKTIRAHAGGANPPVSISSVSEAAAHIAALQGTVSWRLHWQLAGEIRRGSRELAGGDGGRRAGHAQCPGD